MRSRLRRLVTLCAGPAGTAVRFAIDHGPGLAGLGLLSYGAWIAWAPAGPMVAGVLILADQAHEKASGGRE
jgi:hypothetical protein